MITAHHEIEFMFSLDEARLVIQLSADVEVHHSDLFYVVKNIRPKGRAIELLPEIAIKKIRSRWVHVDSEKESSLAKPPVGASMHCTISCRSWPENCISFFNGSIKLDMTTNQTYFHVGIGASAGGLDALTGIFSAFTTGYRGVYFVSTHLLRYHKTK